MSTTFLLITIIFFFAAATRGIFGFGAALVSMPLLTLIIPITLATPLVALIGMTMSLTLTWWYRREISFADTRPLMIGALVGMPIGIWLLIDLPEALVVGILGAALVAFGIYSLVKPANLRLEGRGWAYAAGFLSGSLGSAYNISGPSVVAYGSAQGWAPERFRATLHAYLLFAQTTVVIVQAVAGLWSAQLWVAYAWAAAGALVGVTVGNYVAGMISAENYNKAVYILIIILGSVLLLRAV